MSNTHSLHRDSLLRNLMVRYFHLLFIRGGNGTVSSTIIAAMLAHCTSLDYMVMTVEQLVKWMSGRGNGNTRGNLLQCRSVHHRVHMT
jgi:hypothetical protein